MTTKPRPRYYLGCCFNGPGGTIAELAISTKPIVQALPEVMFPACPICPNGHTITCAEVSFDQFMYGASASAREQTIDDDLGELEATEAMAREIWLPNAVSELYENGPGSSPATMTDTHRYLARLQLIAEELDLNWSDLVVSLTSAEQRGVMAEFLRETNDG